MVRFCNYIISSDPKNTPLHHPTQRQRVQIRRGLITLAKDDITFRNINIPKTINTHNTELQLIKIHIGNTKDIFSNTYFPPKDTTSPHYNTVDTDITYCIRHVTNIPDSIHTGDVNAYSTLWYSHTDDHRGQLISDIISNSEHIILTPTHPPECRTQHYSRPPHQTLQLSPQHYTTAHNTRTKPRSPSHNHNTRTKYKL